MSDVMKQVVQEVLKGNKTIISKRVNQRSQNTSANASLKHIKRPNYQRLKQDHRLSHLKKQPTGSSTNSVSTKTNQPRRTVSLLPKQFNEDSISKLNSIALVQGKVPKQNRSYRPEQQKTASVVGKTKDGGCVWLFPELPMELMGSFQRSLNNVAVGVIRMPKCLPSYILLLNEVIRNNQEVKFHIAWDKEGKTPFTAELYDEDVDRLERIMHDIYQKLNRRSLKQVETYTAVSPSSWLSSQLKISSSVEAIAILEGVSYYTSIVLLDIMLKNYENTDVNYEINNHYLLLKGNYHAISKLIKELKKEAAQIASSDIMD